MEPYEDDYVPPVFHAVPAVGQNHNLGAAVRDNEFDKNDAAYSECLLRTK